MPRKPIGERAMTDAERQPYTGIPHAAHAEPWPVPPTTAPPKRQDTASPAPGIQPTTAAMPSAGVTRS